MLLKIKNIVKMLKHEFNKFPIKISLLYFIISFLWILLSDRINQKLITNNEVRLIISMIKGWIYVIVISLILYYLLNRTMKRLEAAENRLLKNYKDLTIAHEELEAVNHELSLSKEKLKQNYDELKHSEDRSMRAQKIAQFGHWELDIAKQTIWASEEAFKIYGIAYTSQFLPLKLVQDMVSTEDRMRMDMVLQQLMEENSDYDVEFCIIRHNDKEKRVLHSIAKLEYDDTGIPLKVLGVVKDITAEKLADQKIRQNHEELTALYEELTASDDELKLQFDEIHRLAYQDIITGLANRLSLQERLTEIIHTSSAKAALLYIDLDNFKNMNDSFGHFFGDTVLAEIGKRLINTVDADTFVARLGGDEFAIVITDKEIIDHINVFAKKLLSNMVTSFKENDITIHMSASIGIAIYPDHANSFDELLKSADTAMYEAKKQGKNQYIIFNQSMKNKLYTKVVMESNLRSAIDNNELVLYYQPVYCLKTKKVHGFEALVRWNSPVYGMVAPSTFIPLAEETGLISQIGKWVLQSACQFINSLNASRSERLMISVNISVQQLAQDDFVGEVLDILKDNDLDAGLLALEITESILMEDVETKLQKIDTLKKHGIKISLDDFGTGYSSLTYLKKLPISILKLDKAFIDDIAHNMVDNDIVKSIIMLANILDLTVVAEGIENKDQFDCLLEVGCDMIQGYYISKPLSETDVRSVLDTIMDISQIKQ